MRPSGYEPVPEDVVYVARVLVTRGILSGWILFGKACDTDVARLS